MREDRAGDLIILRIVPFPVLDEGKGDDRF